MSTVFKLPRAVAVQSDGTPYGLAKLYFYVASSSTPASTYQDSALTTAHANPVVADANGVFPAIYLDQAVSYKVTLKTSADVLIYTVDPVDDHWTQEQIGAVLYPRTAAEITAGVTPTDYAIPHHEAVGVILLARYGLAEDSTGAQNRAAIEAGDAVADQLAGGVLRAGAGAFEIDATVTFSGADIILEGIGKSTQWVFDPASADVLFDFTAGASISYRCGVRTCSFKSSNSTTKTAIKVRDAKGFFVTGVLIAQTDWPGSASVGLHTLGRERVLLKDSEILCARPWLVDVNPNFSTLHTDFFAAEDLILGSTESTGIAVEIANGVCITNMAFKRVAFVLGKWAVKWADTTSSINSYAITFEDCRVEQAADATGFAYEFTTTGKAIQNISWRNCYIWNGSNGAKLRNARNVSFIDTHFSSAAGRVALDITFVSQTELVLLNTAIASTETVTLTSGVLVKGTPIGASDVGPRNAVYRYDEGAVISQKLPRSCNDSPFWDYKGTLANNATLSTPLLRSSRTCAIVHVAAYSATGLIVRVDHQNGPPGRLKMSGGCQPGHSSANDDDLVGLTFNGSHVRAFAWWRCEPSLRA